MKQSELLRLLRKHGWKITEEGANHHLLTNSNFPGIQIPLTRSKKEIPTGTVKAILKQAGLQ